MATESSFDDLDYGLDRNHAVLSDNNIDDDLGEGVDTYNKVPDSKHKDDTPVMEDNMVDFINVKRDLEEAGKEFGIPITPEMENYALSLSAQLDASGDSLAWFVAAISYQNNMKTLPNMVSLIEDLRAEIKSLQSANKALAMTSGDIIKKMTGVKDDILSGFEGLRRSVLDKIVAIPTQVEAAMGGSKLETITTDKGKGIKPVNKPVPPSTSKQEWIKKKTDDNVSPSTSKNETKQTEVPSSVASAKIKYLKKMGISPVFIKAIPESVIDKLVHSDELMILVEKWGSEEADAVIGEVELRVMMLENDLLS